MSKYLDFIGSEIKKRRKHEAAIALGSALFATIIAKHFANKKEVEEQDYDYWEEDSDHAFIQFAQQEPSYEQDHMFDDKTQPYSFMKPSISHYNDENSTVPKIGSYSPFLQQDSEAEEELSFLDQTTAQFDPFENEFSYDTSPIHQNTIEIKYQPKRKVG